MNIVGFMRSTSGRVLRAGVGTALAVVGLLLVQGTAGIVLVLVGGVMILAGTVNFCLLAPLFGADLWGRQRTTR